MCYQQTVPHYTPPPFSQHPHLQRALELLSLPDDGRPRLLLDVGCGSGLSGEALSDAGHAWVGVDISASMLEVAAEREVRWPRPRGL